MKTCINKNAKLNRTGMVAMDLVMSLSVMFTIAFSMYLLALAASQRLYHFIATMVGSPFI